MAAAIPTSQPSARFSPGFLVASLLMTLTLGAGSGLFYLWRIGRGADVPVSHRQIHAHTQVLGFATLFIMGIAFHVLPRMLGATLASERLKKVVLWAMVSGVLLRNLAQPFAFFWFGRGLSFLSGALEALAGVLFAMWALSGVFGTRQQPTCGSAKLVQSTTDSLRVFVPVAAVCLLAAVALSMMQGAWIAAERDASLPGTLTEPFYVVSLYGFVLACIFGFAGRMLPAFLGIGPARRGTFRLSVTMLTAGVALASTSWVPAFEGAALALRDAGTLLLSLSAVVYLAGTGALWRPVRPEFKGAPGAPVAAIRLAFSFLGVWSLLGAFGVSLARLSELPARNPWWNDAARHVFTIGFLTLLIVGISLKVVPAFTGKRLAFPLLGRATWALIALGVAMRLLQYPAAYKPALYVFGSYMGVPVVLALVFFTVNLMRTVKSTPPASLPAR